MPVFSVFVILIILPDILSAVSGGLSARRSRRSDICEIPAQNNGQRTSSKGRALIEVMPEKEEQHVD